MTSNRRKILPELQGTSFLIVSTSSHPPTPTRTQLARLAEQSKRANPHGLAHRLSPYPSSAIASTYLYHTRVNIFLCVTPIVSIACRKVIPYTITELTLARGLRLKHENAHNSLFDRELHFASNYHSHHNYYHILSIHVQSPKARRQTENGDCLEQYQAIQQLRLQ